MRAATRKRRLLSGFAATFGIVCIAIALAHLALGPRAIPGSIPVNATMDSEDRFYATLFLGFGAAMVWSSRDLARRAAVFTALMAVFWIGGVARILSALMVGPPNLFFTVMTVFELTIPPTSWLWLRRALEAVDRNDPA